MKRLATPLLVSALVGAVVSATGAMAAEPPVPPATTTPPTTPALRLPESAVGEFSVPEDAKYYSDLLSIFQARPLQLGDGRFGWLYSRQRTADDARALGSVNAAPLVPTPGAARTPLTYATVAGSTALRTSDFGSTRSSVAAAAVDGGTWVADSTITPRPSRTRLVLLSDEQRVVRRLRMPTGVRVLAIVPTSRGVRVVGIESKARGRRFSERIVVSGPGARGWIRDPYLSANSPVVGAALPDGSLLVSGRSRSRGGLPDPVLRVSPSGRIARMADRRKPDATTFTAEAGLVETALGVVALETSGDGARLPAADVKDAVVVRGARGRVLVRRYLRDLDLGLPPVCRAEGASRRVAKVLAGPDGLPVLDVRCNGNDSQSYSSGPPNYSYTFIPPTERRVLVGLAKDLTTRWTTDGSALVAPNAWYGCAHHLTGTDGRLWSLSCDGKFTATEVPGSTVATGKLRSSKRDGKRGALARISCDGTWGAVCSGTATVTVGSTVVGTAVYTLPARPGRAASVLDRHIPTSAPIRGRFKVTLQPAR